MIIFLVVGEKHNCPTKEYVSTQQTRVDKGPILWEIHVPRLDDLQGSLGTRPTTWLTPGFSVTERTPGIAAQAGIKTLLDFVDDDVPFHLAHEERRNRKSEIKTKCRCVYIVSHSYYQSVLLCCFDFF